MPQGLCVEKEVRVELGLLYAKSGPIALVGQIFDAGDRAGSGFGLFTLRDRCEITSYGMYVLKRWTSEFRGTLKRKLLGGDA
jgi:hypothetical protein